MNKTTENKGITLIALVITIIVLLILAAVTLNITLGENGIFTKARTSKEKMQYASAKEIVDLKVLEINSDVAINGEEFIEAADTNIRNDAQITIEKYLYESNSLIKNGVTRQENNGTPIAISGIIVFVNEYPQYKFLIGEEGIEGVTTEEITGATTESSFQRVNEFEQTHNFETSTNQNTVIETGPRIKLIDGTIRTATSADYGRKIKYLNTEGNAQMAGKVWRLYYIEDEENTFGDGKWTIYLKADWTDNSYTPSSDTSYDSSKTLVRQLNPKWANGATSGNNSTKRGEISESLWNYNEKAAARLCDPTKWEPTYKSANPIYSENIINWVIGAPPAEMHMKSYGQAINDSRYEANYFYSDYPGYKFSTNTNTNEISTDDDTISQNAGFIVNNKGMYLDESKNSAPYHAYWLASPSCYAADYVCHSGGMYANVNSTTYTATDALCPLVSLKSSFVLEEIE